MWTSELDVCVVSPSVLSRVSGFSVVRDESLPSDHAPLCLNLSLPGVDTDSLLARAQRLGEYVVNSPKQKSCAKSIDIKCVNHASFLDKLPDIDNFVALGDIDETVKEITDTLYHCANVSGREGRVEAEDGTLGRWERMIMNNNDLEIWKAIDWKGDYGNANKSDVKPSDDEFKEYYEHTFNPPNSVSLEPDSYNTDVYIPVLDDPIRVYEVIARMKKKQNQTKLVDLMVYPLRYLRFYLQIRS